MKRLGAIRAVGLAILGVVTAAAALAKGIEDFTLLKAIPADACFAMGSRDHAGKEFINKQTARVMEAVDKAKLDQVLKRFIKLSMEKSGEHTEDFDAHWQKIADLIAGVNWSHLGEREAACGYRLGGSTAPLEFVWLFMPPTDQLKSDFDGLASIFKNLSDVSNGMATLSTDGKDLETVHKLTVQGVGLPLILTLAIQKNVILLGFGSAMPEQSLALLKGDKGAAIASAPRFKDVLSKVAPPTDVVVFCDIAKLIGQVRGLIDSVVTNHMPPAAGGGAEAADLEMFKKLPGKVLDLIDMFDVAVSSGTTEGMKSTVESCTVLKDDAKTHGLYPILYGEQPLGDPLKFVPKAAGNFSVASGWNLSLLYPTIAKFVKENVPHGADGIAQVEAAAKTAQIDIEKDVFGWIGGAFVSVTIPGPTSYSASEFAYRIKVKDEAKAKEILGRITSAIEAQFAASGGTVTDAEIEGATGYKAIGIPQLALFMPGKIILGVSNGWLTVASSPKLVASMEAVAAGKEPNVSANERFTKEGLKPGPNARSASFSDMTRFGEELSAMLSTVGVVQGFMPAEMKNDPALGTLFSVLTKVSTIVRKIDFLQSESSVSTFDGKVLMAKSVMNYREPPAATTPKPGAEPAEKTDKPDKPSTKQ